MHARLAKLIWKIFWTVVFLIFINNPASPLSIPVFWNEAFYWAPIFRVDYVSFYQILFSIFVLAELLIAVFEYIFPDMVKHCEIVHELVDLAQLVVIRDIPKAAINLSASTLDQVYPIAFWIINVIMFFTVIGIIFKALHLSRRHHNIIKPK